MRKTKRSLYYRRVIKSRHAKTKVYIRHNGLLILYMCISYKRCSENARRLIIKQFKCIRIRNHSCSRDIWFFMICYRYTTLNVEKRFRHLHVLSHVHFFLFPKIEFSTNLPIFLSSPCLVVGNPVFLLIFCFAAVIPTALFQEKLNPRIFICIAISCNTQKLQQPKTTHKVCSGTDRGLCLSIPNYQVPYTIS